MKKKLSRQISADGFSRRRFLKTSALAALGGWAVPHILPGRVWAASPNNKIGVGIIGCGGRGFGAFRSDNDAQCVAACDPIREKREKVAEKHGGCKTYNDLRELLADPAVDAVYVATPDHWHVPATLLALQAGKHVYMEKPFSTSLEQDFACRAMVKRTGKVFQYGAMQRSMPTFQKGIELVLNGHIGEVKEIVQYCIAGATGGKPPAPQPVPEGTDWNLWLGPAPERPYDAQCAKGGDWGWFYIYDFSIGHLANWGAHMFDTAQWWADQAGAGVIVHVEGTGKLDRQAYFNTVAGFDMRCRFTNGVKLRLLENLQAAKLDFPGKPDDISRISDGTVFIGTDGWLFVNRHRMYSSQGSYEQLMKEPPSGAVRLFDPGKGRGDHFANFYKAIREGGTTVGNVESSVRSDVVSHLCDFAVRLGRPIQWDPKTETVVGDQEAAAMFRRPMREPFSLKTIIKA